MSKFRGLGIAIITPFNKQLDIDFEALGHLIEYWISDNADYLIVMGTTGESATLEPDEKKELISFCVNKIKNRVPLVVGIGGNNTRQVIRSLETLDVQGISGILSVAPYYNKPNQEGLYQHFKLIAETSPLPIILYNVPSRTGSNMLPVTTLRLARDFEKIVGIKEASGNLDQITEIIKERPSNFLVISGDDNLTFPLMALGADGLISVVANAFTKEYAQMVKALFENNIQTARRIHLRHFRLVQLLFADGSPGGIKYILRKKELCEDYVRPPLWEINDDTKRKIDLELIKLNPSG